ncbi:MAG: DUF664 domain-containing protein [Streptosporangiaceae bacterium]
MGAKLGDGPTQRHCLHISRASDSLATTASIPNPGEDQAVPLRVIVTHMIEETGRHAGHADILRPTSCESRSTAPPNYEAPRARSANDPASAGGPSSRGVS